MIKKTRKMFSGKCPKFRQILLYYNLKLIERRVLRGAPFAFGGSISDGEESKRGGGKKDEAGIRSV